MEQTRCSNSDKEAKYVLCCVVDPFVSAKLTSATTQLRADAARFTPHIAPPLAAPPLEGGPSADTPADTLFNLGGITKTQSLYNNNNINNS